ncbi:prepilin-type N-terminal cleavage/methylation domain-containing protein [Marinomonas sp. 15G1-11]|uniref:Prepilin-type N-terminal cleavage/methylation domain-containing protein n=1 Tax=Marinomonas phaeophyticola TaxID=3004091 RepID=A0ABT4JT24_9GAMM|nr:prepilin-type N-terminal cleavage/methylation domain-containing protein [Marinomonas sp. 15G1-11]MCZ2721538.1 prepilin-type N-terminal cleavage/methylation domain-containing protein [Marinomonas sp. 15G1-11]
MARLESHSRTQFAFTLLELLVVLAVLGGMLSLVSFHYQTDTVEQELVEESQRVRLFLQSTLDKAWLDGVTYGAKITADEIVLLELKGGSWEPLSKRYQVSNAGMEWHLVEKIGFTNLSAEGRDLIKNIDLVFAASGEYTPFELHLMSVSSDPFIQSSDKQTRVLIGDGANAFVFATE